MSPRGENFRDKHCISPSQEKLLHKKLSMRPRSTAPLLPWGVKKFVLGTSKTKYIEGSDIGARIHSFRGATIWDLIYVMQQCSPLNIRYVTLIFGLNNYSTDNFHIIERSGPLIHLIIYTFNPSVLIAPKIIPSTNNRLINHRLHLKNAWFSNCCIFVSLMLSPPLLIYRRSCFVALMFVFLYW